MQFIYKIGGRRRGSITHAKNKLAMANCSWGPDYFEIATNWYARRRNFVRNCQKCATTSRRSAVVSIYVKVWRFFKDFRVLYIRRQPSFCECDNMRRTSIYCWWQRIMFVDDTACIGEYDRQLCERPSTAPLAFLGDIVCSGGDVIMCLRVFNGLNFLYAIRDCVVSVAFLIYNELVVADLKGRGAGLAFGEFG